MLYFDGKDTSVEKIGDFGARHFGEYGGYAQQYLFYYAKTVKAGKKV
jgi:N-glycosylase/DNA lyase